MQLTLVTTVSLSIPTANSTGGFFMCKEILHDIAESLSDLKEHCAVLDKFHSAMVGSSVCINQQILKRMIEAYDKLNERGDVAVNVDG
jgi:hypothetical protein